MTLALLEGTGNKPAYFLIMSLSHLLFSLYANMFSCTDSNFIQSLLSVPFTASNGGGSEDVCRYAPTSNILRYILHTWH